MIKLAIFHYHLLPGGVTDVISLSVQAVIRYLPEIESITLVSGNGENREKILHQIKISLPEEQKNYPLKIDAFPEIGYFSDIDTHSNSADLLKKKLLSRYRGQIWLVHNYHIGKNPFFTKALLEIAETMPDQKIIFQVHDFPECSRYENLRLLYKYVKRSLYSSDTNVRYVVINSRDKEFLLCSGMNKEQLFLLNNPLSPSLVNNSKDKDIKNLFKKKLSLKFPDFNPEYPVILYPVRTIRRKNVLEAGFLTALASENTNLIVTLPGISAQEKPCSDVVEKCFKEHTIKGLWGIGNSKNNTTVNFSDIISASDMIISSSVQEGFGNLFINSIQWNIPLFARNLDILGGIMDIFTDHPHYFYNNIDIPLNNKKKDSLRDQYFNRIEQVAEFLNKKAMEKLKRDILLLLSGDFIDFSYLSIEQQHSTLKSLKDRGFHKELSVINKNLIDNFNILLSAETHAASKKIEDAFGLEKYALTIKEILSSFEFPLKTRSAGDPFELHKHLLNKFASKEYLRLLYK